MDSQSTEQRAGGLDPAVAGLVEAALGEDVGGGDVTSLWTVPDTSEIGAVVVAKQPLVPSGVEIARSVFLRVDDRIDVTIHRTDGSSAVPGDPVLELRGPTRGILVAERTALNFLGRLSGIATYTRRFVDAVEGTGARIIDTRKTTPGWRTIEKAAVRHGGGTNHRMGLFDMVMVKDNHIAAAGGVEQAVARVRHHNTQGLEVEVEVTTIHELMRLLPLGVDRVLLDNMPLETLQEAVRRVRSLGEGRPLTEASGNVTLGTVRAIAETGVDFISVGALTHSAPVADLSLRVT